MHGSCDIPVLTGDPAATDARARRIAALSAEYLMTSSDRREAIAEEIAGLIAGQIVPLSLRAAPAG